MVRVIIGIILVVLGFTITIKSEAVYKTFGPIQWAESKLQSYGGSRFFYQLIGVVFIFVGMLAILNLHESLVGWLLSPLINR